jgi:hypothetical protein
VKNPSSSLAAQMGAPSSWTSANLGLVSTHSG